MIQRMLYKSLWKHISKKQISLIIGARQTGKTTLMKQIFTKLKKGNKQTFFISLENPTILETLNQHPDNLFKIIPPLNENDKMILFLDEIQYLKNPTNFLKYHYDLNQNSIKIIASGSSAFYINKNFKDSLAGRKRIFILPTFNFEEFLISKNREEIIPYINSGNIPEIYKSELIKWLNEYLIFGGYPEVVIEKDLSEFSLEVLNAMGNTVYYEKKTLKNKIQINLKS